MQTTLHNSPATVVFCAKDLDENPLGSPRTGAPSTARVG